MNEDNPYFIHNEQEYNDYKKLKPVKLYKYKKVKFICSVCQKESVKTFRNLTTAFICSSCTRRQVQLRDDVQLKKQQTCLSNFNTKYPGQSQVVKNKIKETNLIKYGVECVWQADEVKEKSKETNLQRYNVENIAQSTQIKEKIKNTNLQRYGCEYYTQSDEYKEKVKETNIKKYGIPYTFQSDEVKQKIKKTNINKYGVENPSQSDEIKIKKLNTCLTRYNTNSYTQTEEYLIKSRKTSNDRYGVDSYTQTDEYKNQVFLKFYKRLNNKLNNLNITIINRTKSKIKLKCLTCGETFTIANSTCNKLIRQYNSSFCPNCSRIITNGRSFKEKELYDIIKTIYNGNILRNDRSILNGKELDFYFPDLKLAIEFNGTYWHADNRFYDANDIIKHCNMTAKEIWEKDNLKKELCNNFNIKLIQIKEYDFDTNKELILNILKENLEKII